MDRQDHTKRAAGQTEVCAGTRTVMLKRLEAVMALVVTAGLAVVSYWLFFSWAQGGGSRREPVTTPVPQERPADS